jgi:hypothetical protein
MWRVEKQEISLNWRKKQQVKREDDSKRHETGRQMRWVHERRISHFFIWQTDQRWIRMRRRKIHASPFPLFSQNNKATKSCNFKDLFERETLFQVEFGSDVRVMKKNHFSWKKDLFQDELQGESIPPKDSSFFLHPIFLLWDSWQHLLKIPFSLCPSLLQIQEMMHLPSRSFSIHKGWENHIQQLRVIPVENMRCFIL